MALDLSPVRPLIIDDNAFIRQLMGEVLVALHVKEERIRYAYDGHAGLEALRAHDFDLVFCDIQMKPMDGITFTRHVRTLEDIPNPTIPIIICTGHAEINHIRDARDAGANEVLRKPISAQNVYERIRSIVERPRQFIYSAAYTGPDRRRQDRPFDGPDRRKDSPVEV